MGLFNKAQEYVANNAAEYTLKLIDTALKEYKKQKVNADILNEERYNAALGFYEKQFIGLVERKTIEAINTAKGVFGEDFKEINMLCKDIEDDVAVISFELFNRDLNVKLEHLKELILQVKDEF